MKKILSFAFVLLFFMPVSLAADNLRFEIKGIDTKAQKNAEQRLRVLLEPYGTTLSRTTIHRFYQQAPQEIIEAIKPFGYFNAQVSSHLYPPSPKWLAIFMVQPGTPMRLAKIKVDLNGPGQWNPVINRYINNLPIQSGNVLQIDQYNKAKENLLQTAYEQGYIQAHLEKNELRIDLKSNTAEVIWQLKTGERFYFGSFLFERSAFSRSFLNRFVTPTHQPFSSEKLLKLQQELSNSQYFNQVEVMPDFKNQTDHEIPVKIKVTEPKKYKYNAAIGYGTFTGPRLTLGYDLRRVTDTGHHFNTELKLSTVLSGLAAKYFIPGKNPLTDEYSIGANIQKFMPKNGHSVSRAFTLSSIKKWDNWQSIKTLNFLNESFKVVDEPEHVSQAIYPSYMLSHSLADNPIFPNNGHKVSFNIQAADERFFSKNSFIQVELKGKKIFSLTENHRFIIRGDFGYTVVEDLNTLPLTLRFFAGGLGSVRGFAYSSLGPGRYLKVGSIEYQYRIYHNFRLATFYDVGTANNQFNASPSRGAGIGLIYSSIIGPLQVYISRAESVKGKPFRIDFNLGPDF